MVIFAAIAAATVFSPISAHAGEPIKAEIGTDIVSSYLWRGSRLDGPAFQPTVGLEWNGLSLSAWGSTGFSDACEVDLTLAYSIGGFTVGVTDYWLPPLAQNSSTSQPRPSMWPKSTSAMTSVLLPSTGTQTAWER